MKPRVVIVGAGLAGAAAAWWLAPDFAVTLVDAAAAPGAEATAQNAGMVRRLGEEPAERALALRSVAFLEALPPDWDGLSVSRVTGAVHGFTDDPTLLHDAVAHLRAHGVPVEPLDAAGLARVAPALAGAPLRGAWFLPTERVADPHALLTGFLRGLRRHGGALRLGLPVTALHAPGGRVSGVHTPAGLLPAEAVVLAAGAWCSALVGPLGLTRPLVPLRRSLVLSAPHPLATAPHPWVWLDDAGLYLRPEGGAFLLSPCDEAVDRPAAPAGPGPLSPLARALTADKLARFVPALAGLPLQRGWSGLRTFAPDREPLIGADPGAPGLFWAAGLGGFGLTCAPAVGEVLAAALRGDSLPWLDAGPVAPGRPALRRFPIRPTGALSSLRLVSA